ncbi:MAG TPA: UbiD family decarboxylase [Acetobacteraceae bacterium]|nr:UbiD family decarboxylase [Acetobacteraceae bacterium]
MATPPPPENEAEQSQTGPAMTDNASAFTKLGCAKDIRTFVEVLEQEDELRRVSAPVDWRYEAGALGRWAMERGAPAPLFENVIGYEGQKILAGALGPSHPHLHARIALALGLPKDTPPLSLIEIVRERIRHPIAAEHVARAVAACKEIVVTQADVDLEAYAIPWIKEIDGGRYVGTQNIVVTRDRASDWVNWGTYRSQLQGKRELTILLFPAAQHGGEMLQEYKKTMPVALVIGADPISNLVAGGALPYGVSESDVAGGLRGEALQLVKCETNDLYVPANAEMVIEAEIDTNSLVSDGPFGEYTGHVTEPYRAPLARVTAVTHRRNPIHTMANMGRPHDEATTIVYLMMSACARNRLEDNGIHVKSVYHHGPGNPAVAYTPKPGLRRQIISTLCSGHRLIGSGIIFVEEDVDVTDPADIWWAINTRMNADTLSAVQDLGANPLYPWLTPVQRDRHEAPIWVLDATFPFDWDADYRKAQTGVSDFSNGFSSGTKERILSRLAEYGYEDFEA